MKTKKMGMNLSKIRSEGQFRIQGFRWLLGNEVDVTGKKVADLGAGPCKFSYVAREFGGKVTAVDARDERVPDDVKKQGNERTRPSRGWQSGNAGATVDDQERNVVQGSAIEFIHNDVRKVDMEPFDVVIIFGLLYHFQIEDQIEILRRCKGKIVMIDTIVSCPDLLTIYPRRSWEASLVESNGYEGWVYPEKENPMASIGNKNSFWHTESSYCKLFSEAGFGDITAYRPMYLSVNGMRVFYKLMP